MSEQTEENQTDLMTMAYSKLKLADCKCLGLQVTWIFIILTSGDMHVRTKTLQIIMNFLLTEDYKNISNWIVMHQILKRKYLPEN